MNIIGEISKNGSDKKQIALDVIRAPEYLPQLLEGLNHEEGRVRFGYEKILRLISESQPALIYPYFETFVILLDSDNNFLKWGAIITLSNLATMDIDNKFETIFDKYFSPITEMTMITAANIIGNSWKIALAKPELTEKIVHEILKAEKAVYENKGQVSPECNNVVCGHAIESFDKFYDRIIERKPLDEFIKRQLNNSRKSVVKKAERFLKKYKLVL